MVIPSQPGGSNQSLNNDEPFAKARGPDFRQAALFIEVREFGDQLQVLVPQGRPVPQPESPARESGAFDLGWDGDDYIGGLAPAPVSAAKVSASVRTADASMRRESVRLTAAAAAETTSAWRA
jgi:hypothetical protein